jgi:cytochrome oxidase assembly protein ShyY1
MPYVLGLIGLAFLATYPLGRWQLRRLRNRPAETGALLGNSSSNRTQFETSAAAQEAVMRGGGGAR